MTDLERVERFWNENPLWSGESRHVVGSAEFFEEHRKIYIDDCFAGNFDLRFLPPPRTRGQDMGIPTLKRLHRWLDRRPGFTIYATVPKPCAG